IVDAAAEQLKLLPPRVALQADTAVVETSTGDVTETAVRRAFNGRLAAAAGLLAATGVGLFALARTSRSTAPAAAAPAAAVASVNVPPAADVRSDAPTPTPPPAQPGSTAAASVQGGTPAAAAAA